MKGDKLIIIDPITYSEFEAGWGNKLVIFVPNHHPFLKLMERNPLLYPVHLIHDKKTYSIGLGFNHVDTYAGQDYSEVHVTFEPLQNFRFLNQVKRWRGVYGSLDLSR